MSFILFFGNRILFVNVLEGLSPSCLGERKKLIRPKFLNDERIVDVFENKIVLNGDGMAFVMLWEERVNWYEVPIEWLKYLFVQDGKFYLNDFEFFCRPNVVGVNDSCLELEKNLPCFLEIPSSFCVMKTQFHYGASFECFYKRIACFVCLIWAAGVMLIMLTWSTKWGRERI